MFWLRTVEEDINWMSYENWTGRRKYDLPSSLYNRYLLHPNILIENTQEETQQKYAHDLEGGFGKNMKTSLMLRLLDYNEGFFPISSQSY